MEAETERECSMTFDRRPAGLLIKFHLYREKKSGEFVSHFEVTPAPKKGSLNSNSGFESDYATMYVPHRRTKERLDSLLVSLE